MEAFDVAVTAIRVWLGAVMLAHGWHHARSLEGTASWFAKKGFRNPELNARASAFGEFAIGAALVVGLATSLAAAGLIAIMTVAFWSIHRFAGFFVFERPDEGWEYVGTLVVAAMGLAILGPGRWSVDAMIGIDSDLAGWTGLLIALAGFAAGAAQLAVFWRKPD
jgi:putative oxidoreductase